MPRKPISQSLYQVKHPTEIVLKEMVRAAQKLRRVINRRTKCGEREAGYYMKPGDAAWQEHSRLVYCLAEISSQLGVFVEATAGNPERHEEALNKLESGDAPQRVF